MNRSLAHSLTLLITVCLAVLAITPVANAATLPGNFFVERIHGNYAWGRYGTGLGSSWASQSFARVDLRTGRRDDFSTPPGMQFVRFGPASDTAITAVAGNESFNVGEQQLLRYDVGRGYQVLDSVTATPGLCSPDINPISIEQDGTVVGVSRVFTAAPNYKCNLDVANTHVKRYQPAPAATEEVWIPAKYRPWILEYNIASSGSSFALAISATSRRPGGVVVLDTARRKVLERRAAGRNPGLSFSNPHSLFISQDSQKRNGKLLHWRIGRAAPRVLYRGTFDLAGNCGARAVLIRPRTINLITTGGKRVLRRRISEDRYFAGIACSSNYLHFLDVVNDDDYYGNSAFDRSIANTSALPR